MIIDSDAHVCEPKDVFTTRLPAKYGDLIPHVEYVEDKDADYWVAGGQPLAMVTTSAMFRGPSGEPQRREHDFPPFPTRFEQQHPSSYDPNERVKVMDEYGVHAATTYPSLGLSGPAIYRGIPGADLAFQMSVVSAYNDWVMTWVHQQPGRFIPLGNIPYWDVDSAVKEIERCAEMGIKGLVMTGKPHVHGCPILADRSWDPIWAASQAADLCISFHAGGGIMGGTNKDYLEERRRVMSPEQFHTHITAVEFLENAIVTMDLLMSGILQRFPSLNFAVVEAGSGWVPFVLETLDVHYKRYRPWLTVPEMSKDELPSELFARQVFVNLWYEHWRPDFPIENMMFESDYPHATCLTGSEIRSVIDKNLSPLSTVDKDKVLFQNAIRCFQLKPRDLASN